MFSHILSDRFGKGSPFRVLSFDPLTFSSNKEVVRKVFKGDLDFRFLFEVLRDVIVRFIFRFALRNLFDCSENPLSGFIVVIERVCFITGPFYIPVTSYL